MEEESWSVMGIDLGTTYSCVGVWKNGRVEIVANDQDNRTTPSYVAFTVGERLIGEGAINQVASNASNTVFDVKRLMGRSFSDASVKSNAKYWPFGVIADGNDKPLITVSYHGLEREFSPEEISAMVLVKMKETAEACLGPKTTIKHAVVTVPAYFNNSQRQATIDAGKIAGLDMSIINEPTAAAIAYSVNTKWRESTVVVYDLGGGTLDVSLVVIKKGELKVIATAGDTRLGGEDFTNKMVDHFVKEFENQNPYINGDISGDKRALGRLRRSCEEAKRKLSTNPHITVELDALFEGIHFYSTLSRDKFEQLNGDLFGKCMEPIAKCLMHAKMDRKKVDDVVLVGGSTRIPRLHRLLQDFFNGKELCRNINADEAVAYGATLQAAILTGIQTFPQVKDITPFSQGICMLDGVMLDVVIKKRTTIPTWIERSYATVKDSVHFTVYEVETAMPTKFHLSGIALAPEGFHEVKVCFGIDGDGILHVSAQDEESGEEGNITITNNVGRCIDEIKRMVIDARKYKKRDEEHKENVQARNGIDDLLYTMRNNMSELQDTAARLLVPQEATGEEKGNPAHQQKTPVKLHSGAVQTASPSSKLPYSISRMRDSPSSSEASEWRGRDGEPQQETPVLQQESPEASEWSGTHSEPQQETPVLQQETLGASQWDRTNCELQQETPVLEQETLGASLWDSTNCESQQETQVIVRHGKHQMAQDKKNKKMIPSQKKLQNSIKKLQETVDETAKWLENKKLTTREIIDKHKQIEEEYRSISSQIGTASPTFIEKCIEYIPKVRFF